MTDVNTLLEKKIAGSLYIQNGLLANSKSDWDHFFTDTAKKIAIISDETTYSLYGEGLRTRLSKKGLDVYSFLFNGGEALKTRATKATLEDAMLDKGLGKDICVIALGGGVVTDLAGFIASTYCRGVDLVLIPTTLLAMVDASVGGKTGINTPHGKNLIGSFYPPLTTLIDTDVLSTLPYDEIKNGIAELIKISLVFDAPLFEFLESESSKIRDLESTSIQNVIHSGIRDKSEIVKIDQFEKGMRRLLNFGHTIGHALEKVSSYLIPHGIAVAIGIATESYIANELKLLSQGNFERIMNSLINYELLPKLNLQYPPEEILQAMTLDKKSLNGLPRFALIDDIGHACTYDGNYCAPVNSAVVLKALNWMIDAL